MKKTALITGGTSGIGLQVVEQLTIDGYHCIAIGSSEKTIATAQEYFNTKNISVELYATDITDEKNIKELFAKITSKHNCLDAIIHSAGGLIGRQNIEEITTDFYKKVMALNLDSLVYIVRDFLPLLKNSKNSPSIVTVTSIAGQNGGGVGVAAYGTAKAGVIALTKNMAKEFIKYGIRVNTISPGVVDTPFHADTSVEMKQNFLESVPMKRFGLAKESADVICFLVSEKSSYITGETINVNGGQLML